MKKTTESLIIDVMIGQITASTKIFKSTVRNLKYLVKTSDSISSLVNQLKSETEQFKSVVVSLKKLIPLITNDSKKAFKDGSPQYFLQSFYDLCNIINQTLKNTMTMISRLQNQRLSREQISQTLITARDLYVSLMDLKKYDILSKTREIENIDQERVRKLIEFFESRALLLTNFIRRFKTML